MSLIIQSILMIVILVGMVLALLSVRALANMQGHDAPEKTARLKQEVEEDNQVVSPNSVFNCLMVRSQNDIPTRGENKE